MHNVKIPDVDIVVKIAQDAGDAILDIYQKNHFQKSLKSDNSPVTIADLTAHNIIVKKLGELTPEVPILSEESILTPWEERKNWKQYWLAPKSLLIKMVNLQSILL